MNTDGTSPFTFAGPTVQLAGECWSGSAARRGTVILLHGGGQTRHSWKTTADRLAAVGWSAIALDARGHGDSEWDPDGDYSIDGFVADLLALTSTLAEPPVLIGASLGGITALLVAGEHPGVARALVLVDVVARVEAAGVDRIVEFMTARPDGFASLDEVADAIAAYNPLRPRPSNLDGLRRNVRRGEDGRWRWHWDPAFVGADGETPGQLDAARQRVAAASVTVPTLIVRGADSDVVSEEGLDDMLRLIPSSTSVDISQTGHMIAGDDNDVFASALLEFLAGLD